MDRCQRVSYGRVGMRPERSTTRRPTKEGLARLASAATCHARTFRTAILRDDFSARARYL